MSMGVAATMVLSGCEDDDAKKKSEKRDMGDKDKAAIAAESQEKLSKARQEGTILYQYTFRNMSSNTITIRPQSGEKWQAFIINPWAVIDRHSETPMRFLNYSSAPMPSVSKTTSSNNGMWITYTFSLDPTY